MSGKLELVNTFTGSSVSSLNLNGCFTDTYEYYDVFFRGLQNADGSNPRPTIKILDDSNLKILSASDLNDAAKKIVEAIR